MTEQPPLFALTLLLSGASMVAKEGDGMEIKQYDRVLLKDGNEAIIVEIFVSNKAFLADIEKDDDIYTEDVTIDQILKVL